MIARLIPKLLLLSFAVSTSFGQSDPPKGFVSLFNEQNLDGWHGRPHFDPRKLAAMSDEQRKQTLDGWWDQTTKHWRAEEGEIVNDGKGPYLTTDREFADFELRLEYKTVAKADSGIYLRGNPQVQIWDFTREGGKWNRGADKGSGGLFNNLKRASGQEPSLLADRLFGEWNQFRIVQVGARTSVWLNDELVVDDAPMRNYWEPHRPQFRTGPIQLQTHGGEIRWRNIFIREISPEEADSILRSDDRFQSVFNGHDLNGWRGAVENYQIVDGAIVCQPGKGGTLFTRDEYADFVVRFEFKLPPGGNNGLAIRYPGTGHPHIDGMCELQILDDTHEKYAKLDARQYHGSAYGMVAAERGFLRPVDEWNFQQVTVQGSRIAVELNGFGILDADLSEVTEFKDDSPHPGKDRTNGYFGFAGHNDPVAFRNIEIRRLDPAESQITRTWPQFRGHNSSGLAVTHDPLPTEIGPDKNVIWKTELPPGHSSPIVFDDRIYVTAVRDEQLVTIALDRQSGDVVWEQIAPHEKLEKIHQIGSYAQCSPVTDGEIVVSMFGSSGLYCYDRHGTQLWSMPMGPFVNDFGAGNSPIIVGERIIVVQDHDSGSFVMAIDKTTGSELWKTDRSEFPRNYCSPVIWEVDGQKQIVIAATLRVAGYDLETGDELWTVRGLSRTVCMTPVIGDDNVLYVAGWARGGDVDERISIPPIDEALSMWDKNENGMLEKDELVKDGDIQRRFNQFDRDRTNAISKQEYENYRGVFDAARNVVMAIRPGGRGDLTETNVAWEFRRFLPFCSSPLYVHDYLFTVKNGGIVTSLNAETGASIKTARAPGTGNYYASPVAGDNKIYLIDQMGHASVLSSYAEWKVLSDVEFGEEAYATPALVKGKIYLRTSGHLYCFGAE